MTLERNVEQSQQEISNLNFDMRDWRDAERSTWDRIARDHARSEGEKLKEARKKKRKELDGLRAQLRDLESIARPSRLIPSTSLIKRRSSLQRQQDRALLRSLLLDGPQ